MTPSQGSPTRSSGDSSKDAKRDFAVATNRKALHDYFVEQTVEAGLALTGTEVKSLRQGKAQLVDSYAAVERGEIFLYKLHISPYEQGNRENHEPMRKRKLLLHRREIDRLQSQTEREGYTLIPLRLYFTRGRAKVAIGVCRGKKAYDKRQTIAKRETDREVRRAMRNRGKGE